jgi:hypothetical protein
MTLVVIVPHRPVTGKANRISRNLAQQGSVSAVVSCRLTSVL